MRAALDPGEGRAPGDFLEAIIAAIHRARLAPGDLALDGGANRGLHARPMAAAVGAAGRVLAVEAVPGRAEALARDLAGLPQVQVAAVALGATEGVARFQWVRGEEALSSLRARHFDPAIAATASEIEVKVTTIDALLAGRGRALRVMKLDLEGGEYDALRGAAAVLRGDRPLVIFENGRQSNADLYGYTREDWFALFAHQGYALFDLFGRPFAPEDWGAEEMPWYFLAAARGSEDEAFIRDALPWLVRALHVDLLATGQQAEMERLRAALAVAQARLAAIEASRYWRAGAGLRAWLSARPRLRSLLSGGAAGRGPPA